MVGSGVVGAVAEVADELDEIAGALEAVAESCDGADDWLLDRLAATVDALRVAVAVLQEACGPPGGAG